MPPASSNTVAITVTLKDRASAAIGGIGRKLESSLGSRGSSPVGKATSGLSSLVGGLGAIAPAGLAVGAALTGVVAGIRLLIGASSDLNAQLANVRAVTAATAEEMRLMKEEARRLGADTKFSSAQAAAGMEQLGKAGFNTGEIIATLPGVLSLAAAENAEMGRTADIVTNIMGQMGLQAADTSRIVDVLAKTSSISATNLEQTSLVFQYAGPLARELGIDIEGLSGTIAVLANNGIKGEKAGTALRGIMSTLLNPTDAAREAMGRLGVEIQGVDGEMRPMVDIIGDVENALKAGGGSFETTKDIAKAFGQEASSAILSLGRTGKNS